MKLSQDQMDRILEKIQELENDPHRFATMAGRPVEFIQDVLGITLWEKQQESVESVVKHRKTAIRSGHGTGKTLSMACLTLYWLYAVQGCVVSTAPTKEHVEDVLWKEINARFARSLTPLPGDIYSTTLKVEPSWEATGLTTNKASAFQGRHHPRLLVIIDEAAGVDEAIHEEISTLATGAENRIVMIGNPTVTSGSFYEAFDPVSPWYQIHISCLEHPNVVSGVELIPGAVTTQWIEEQRSKYGEQHPWWFARVLGEFPTVSSRGVIPMGWAERACDDAKQAEALEQAEKEHYPRIGGLDVARYGDNRCVYTQRRGDAVEKIISWSHASLMETANLGAKLIKEEGLEILVIDANGIGAGVYDRLLELGQPVLAYNGGHRAFTATTFSNRRSEMWWAIRERLEKKRLWLPKRHEHVRDVIKDLIAPEYSIIESGRLRVETKERLLDRGIRSPDYADSLVLCFAHEENPFLELEPKPDRQDRDEVAWESLTAPLDATLGDFGQLPTGF